ncbi:MAG: 16S rRNA (adenine(1518)-N(6)/adenine(1519)-N(6))-dimethyltransferase RsmA [Actinomycetota bacterium]|nr:16S rRNA (adenine(1518)-N(6)/adenine(1519)-N(6))-dimethyltransferase RsmA [Actinomycetota bacterium]
MATGREAPLLTPADIRRLLDEHGLAPRKTAGQNFVVDPNTVRKVVRDAGVTAGDVVVEVGAGLGSLTLALSEVARRIVAVEIDAGLVSALRDVVGDRDHIDIVHADALRVDLDAVVGGEPARLVANLPYNVATPVVFHALDGQAITDLFVMVQREVGERWAAQVGDRLYGAVSVKLQLVADVDVVARVPPTVFYPVPKVDSVTVRIVRRHPMPDPAEHRVVVSVVEAAFAQRRKTLRNALRARTRTAAVEEALEAAGIDPGARAEELDPAAFRRLATHLADHLPAGSGS